MPISFDPLTLLVPDHLCRPAQLGTIRSYDELRNYNRSISHIDFGNIKYISVDEGRKVQDGATACDATEVAQTLTVPIRIYDPNEEKR